MSDNVTSLVIAVISLVGTVTASGIAAWLAYYGEERKARREIDKILLKYRDPLLLSAQDLQARLYGICDQQVMEFMEMDGADEGPYQDTLFIYTAYVVGQYLSWYWILRRQAQFVAFITNTAPKWWFWPGPRENGASTLVQKLDKIRTVFTMDDHGDLEHSFILFKAHQIAIGEIMSIRDDASGEYYCMGFATFTKKWKNGDPYNRQRKSDSHTNNGAATAGLAALTDVEFRQHFIEIERGIKEIWHHRLRSHPERAPPRSNCGHDGRLRRLQHLMLDLIGALDPNGALNNAHESRAARAANHCICDRAECRCKCAACGRNPKHIVPGVPIECRCKHCRPPKHAHPGPDSHDVAVTATSGAEKVDADVHERNGQHV